MTVVEAPGGELEQWIAEREASDLSRYDYWREGSYVVVTGPDDVHGWIVGELIMKIVPLAKARGLRHSSPLNIGRYQQDTRTPDIGVFEPSTPLTSPAFRSTAAFVVEVISEGEDPDAKLEFYTSVNVDEYLAVSKSGELRLRRRDGDQWIDVTDSIVLGASVDELGDIDWPE